MALEWAVLSGMFYQVNKSMEIDDQATKKNIKAFTKTADAQAKLEKSQENVYNKLIVNAKRKNGILVGHLNMFQEQYKVIKQIQFKRGRGIIELEQIDEIQKKLNQYVSLPVVSTGKMMTDSQLMLSFVLKGGIGGLMITESKDNLKLASKNMAQANAVSAQIDSICIALDGIAQHIDSLTLLLERLGMLYIKSIKNLTEILNKNGLNEDNYSDQEIDAINVSLGMTKLIYRIINTPVIDENGNIEQESLNVIREGQQKLDHISNSF